MKTSGLKLRDRESALMYSIINTIRNLGMTRSEGQSVVHFMSQMPDKGWEQPLSTKDDNRS